MISLARDLCRFRTGVVADENGPLFDRIEREVGLTRYCFRSGDEHNGWQVPQNWRVKKALLRRNDEVVFDGTSHTLGVGYYSKPFTGELEWDALKAKLVTNPTLPDAYMFHCMWQYRPWDADWRLCIPYNIYKTLGPGRYQVEIETEYLPGEMLVAHHEKPGLTDKLVVFHSNTCHPHMANDGFAGTAVLIRLFQWLAQRETRYSYRLVLGPEHVGTVFYARDLPTGDIDRMVGGVFEEMPGTNGPIKATSTFLGGHKLDRAFANVLAHYSRAHALVGWRKGAGNDETVWEAPGIEVPFVEVTRCEDQFAPYREYHSSLDTPDIMVPGQLDEMLDVLKRVVEVIEGDATIDRRFDGLICLSNPAYNLYLERPDPAVVKDLEADAEKWGHLLDCLFRYFDGRTSILDIAERHGLPFDRLHRYLTRFAEKGLVEMTWDSIPRTPPRRVAP